MAGYGKSGSTNRNYRDKYNQQTEEIEERISGDKDTLVEKDPLIKENSKSNKVLTQNIQEIWETMKRPNLRIIEVEGEEYQLKGPENIFNKIVEENFPNLKKDIPMKVQETYRTPNRLAQKKIPSPYNNQNTKHTE